MNFKFGTVMDIYTAEVTVHLSRLEVERSECFVGDSDRYQGRRINVRSSNSTWLITVLLNQSVSHQLIDENSVW
jgi:hypothetical protein